MTDNTNNTEGKDLKYSEADKDRLVNEAVKTNAKKWQEKVDELSKKVVELENANLTAEQRAAKAKAEEQEATRKTIEELQRKVRISDARALLTSAGLPATDEILSAYANMSDDAMRSVIKVQSEALKAQVKAGVEENLKSLRERSAPKSTTGVAGEGSGGSSDGFKPYNIFS